MTKLAHPDSSSRARLLTTAALALVAALFLPAGAASAQQGLAMPAETTPRAESEKEEEPEVIRLGEGIREEDGIVIYEPEFFERYNPVTALDMVSRTPGFSLSRDRGSRGFGAASGNVLINGERPSSKSDSVRDILSRIPAGQVQQVELIRGATGGLDVQGQSVVANVVLQSQQAGSGFVELGSSLQAGDVAFRGELAYDSELGPVDFLASVSRWEFNRRSIGTEDLTRPDGTGEVREEISTGTFGSLSFNLRTEAELTSRDTLRLSGQFRHNPGDSGEISERFDLGSDDIDVVERASDRLENSYEIGGDYERDLGASARLKVIGLVRRENRDNESNRFSEMASGESDRSVSMSESVDGEDIGRVELDWRVGDHSLQASGEVARNFVESDFRLFLTVDGDFQEVDLSGSNTRVSETRSDWLVSDSWNLHPNWTLDTGLGFEVSTIRQTGDVSGDRTFRFLKPSLALTYSPSRGSQLRLRAEREVSQLNFFDFVSSADFEDEDLEFGNPELEPERTWAFEATYERRFGEVGVVETQLFYDAIEEVQDLLPLGDTLEIPGNIGDGTRYGVSVDATIGLGALGLRYAQLELGARLQSTSVTDPVTGADRSLSGEEDFRGSIGYRQEAPELALSWGASYRGGSDEVSYGLDEIDIEDDPGRLDAFAEKIVWDGIKIRARVENLLDGTSIRDRTVFAGPRTEGSILFRELRRRVSGREFSITLSRTF